MKSIVLTILFFIIYISKSNAQVAIDGEIRVRSEYRQGFRKPLIDTLKPLFITFQRTRLCFDYKSKSINSNIKIQDARIWGESNVKQLESKIAVMEAWAEWIKDSTFSVKVGRQPLMYDDQRLFASGEWNYGNQHDIFLVKLKPRKSFELQAGFAYNNSIDTLMSQNYAVSKMYKTMGLLWVQKSFANGLKISGIAVEEGLQQNTSYKTTCSRFTGGGNVVFQNDSSKLNFSVLGYYQIGKTFSFLNLEAAMAAAKISYQFYKSNSFFLALNYYSGSKPDILPGTTHNFNKLYGSNHSVDGNMEYWGALPAAGLIDYFGGFTSQFNPKLNASLTFRVFNFAQKCIIDNQELSKNIGQECDLVFDYYYSKEINLQFGYCMYFSTSSTKIYNKIANANTYLPIWTYLMLTFKPNFYKSSHNK